MNTIYKEYSAVTVEKKKHEHIHDEMKGCQLELDVSGYYHCS